MANNASLQVNGELSSDPEALEGEVIFEGDRLEPGFSDIPGQWGTIWLTDGSTGNVINHATIKNATVGVLMESNDGTANPTLTINNTQIYNSANVGLLARTGNVSAENLVINNSGQVSLNCSLGGTYNFNHCTFANYTNGIRQFPSVLIDNNLQISETEVLVADLIEANFTDCIIYGDESIELILSKVGETVFNYKFTNCLIQFNDFNNRFDGDPLYDFQNSGLFENIIFNSDPEFKAPRMNDLIIGDNSAANGQASIPGSGSDILGVLRSTDAPDIGAYESIIFDEGN